MRVVIKTGSAVLSRAAGADGPAGLDRSAIDRLCRQLARLHAAGHEVVLVPSGAIAAGVGRLGWTERPEDLRMKQAAAAVGQLALMEAYEEALSRDGILPAQILLTREDLIDRRRYLNVRSTVLHLLSLRALPILNENDSVSTDEIQFGDNDTLSAAVATKIGADKLILLSDVPGVFELDGDGRLTDRVLPEIAKVTAEMEKRSLRVKGSALSVGGMVTKLAAAKMATAAGIETWIASGRDPEAVDKIMSGQGAGTRFLPRSGRLASRGVWIAFGRSPKGDLVLDPGAVTAVADQRKSLLPSGVKRVKGRFQAGDTVRLVSADGHEVARGLVNFSAEEMSKIRGRHSREIPELLGRQAAGEVIHRDNLVLL